MKHRYSGVSAFSREKFANSQKILYNLGETPPQSRPRSTAPPSSQAKTVEPSTQKPEPINLPYRPLVQGKAEAMGWVPENEDHCHQVGIPGRTNIKYIPSDGGGEQIFYKAKDEDVVVEDQENEATYNFFNPKESPKLHGVFDVAPWFLWGNSPDDTTTMLERGVLPFVYEAYEEKKKHT